MKKIVRLAVFLGIICVVASFVLYNVNNMTAPIIEERMVQQRNELLSELYPEADDFKEEKINENNIIAVYTAMKGDQELGTVYQLSIWGFQSALNHLVAINPDGTLGGMKVISQAETPGFGTQIVTNQDYVDQFFNSDIEKGVNTIAGATVTTAAMNVALDSAITHWKAHHQN